MTAVIPAEADWARAPSLIDGATTLELTPADCNLQYWLRAVPQGTLRGQVLGHGPESVTPDFMREPGPLNEALTSELAFRSIAEDKATRAIGYLVSLAPDTDSMEFYATQLMDEARHAMVFRSHLLELGIAQAGLPAAVERLAAQDRDRILVPLEDLGLRVLRDERDFIGGVVVLTVLVEGILAPAAELSERKWRPLDPAAADIERGAGIDEIRHLTVGSSVAREFLQRHPADRERMLGLIAAGRELWEGLPRAGHGLPARAALRKGHAGARGRRRRLRDLARPPAAGHQRRGTTGDRAGMDRPDAACPAGLHGPEAELREREWIRRQDPRRTTW